MNDQQEYAITKTVIISLLLGFVSVLFFCFKVGSCNSTDQCKDEFLQLEASGIGQNKTCFPGATVEVVQAPKPGILCHCNRGNVSNPASSIVNAPSVN